MYRKIMVGGTLSVTHTEFYKPIGPKIEGHYPFYLTVAFHPVKGLVLSTVQILTDEYNTKYFWDPLTLEKVQCPKGAPTIPFRHGIPTEKEKLELYGAFFNSNDELEFKSSEDAEKVSRLLLKS